jgi:hypothetical protein
MNYQKRSNDAPSYRKHLRFASKLACSLYCSEVDSINPSQMIGPDKPRKILTKILLHQARHRLAARLRLVDDFLNGESSLDEQEYRHVIGQMFGVNPSALRRLLQVGLFPDKD